MAAIAKFDATAKEYKNDPPGIALALNSSTNWLDEQLGVQLRKLHARSSPLAVRTRAEGVLHVGEAEIPVREQEAVCDREKQRRELVRHRPVHHLEHLARGRVARHVRSALGRAGPPESAEQCVAQRLGLVPLRTTRGVETRDPGRPIEFTVRKHGIRHPMR